MPLPLTLHLGCPLLLCDLALLALLGWGTPTLAPLGLPAPWLEAAVRLLGLWGAWALLAPAQPPHKSLATLCLLPPLYLPLRGFLPLPDVSPILLAGAPWTWLLLSYGAVGLAQLTWGALGHLGDGASDEQVEKNKKSRAMLWRLLGLCKADVLYLSGAFTFLTIGVIGDTFIPYYIGQVIDILGSSFDPKVFSGTIFLLCIASFSSSLAVGCREGLFTLAESRLNTRLRQLLFFSLVHQDLGFFETTKTGDLTSHLSTDIAKVGCALSLDASVFLRSLVKALGIYYFMFSLSWRLTLLMLFETPITIVAEKINNVYYQALLKDVQDSMAHSGEVVCEVISSIETVRSFATEQEESRRYDVTLADTHQLKNRRDLVQALYVLFRQLLQLAMQVVMLCYGHQQIQNEHLTKGNLVAFILYQMTVGQYVQTLVYMYGDLLCNVGAAEKVFEYLDREPAVQTDGTWVSESPQGHVSFRNVSFCYPSRPDCQVLKIRQSVLSRGPRTVLVIAHRMQTVEHADRIVVLEGGAVAEEGTHAELMKRQGPYYRLVQRDLVQ